MEWLLLLLILVLPVLRFVLLPARVASRLHKLPLGSIAIASAVVIAGWFVLQAFTSPDERTARYNRGDAQLRALIE